MPRKTVVTLARNQVVTLIRNEVVTLRGISNKENNSFYFEFYDPAPDNSQWGLGIDNKGEVRNRLYIVETEEGILLKGGAKYVYEYEVTQIRPNGNFPAGSEGAFDAATQALRNEKKLPGAKTCENKFCY